MIALRAQRLFDGRHEHEQHRGDESRHEASAKEGSEVPLPETARQNDLRTGMSSTPGAPIFILAAVG